MVNHIFVIGYNSVYCTGKIGKPTLKIEAYAEADHRNNRSLDFATLDRLAKSNDVSKKEFLSCALEYFEKYGINPVQHESPAKEMQKLIKRCDQVIAFIRKQEQDILRPACAAISTTEARIERVLDKLATAGQVRDLQKAVSDQQQRQNYDARNLRSDILQLLGRATEQERKAFMYLGKLVDAKEKSGFFNDIATLYKEQG